MNSYKSRLYEKLYSYHKSHDGAFDVALDIATGMGQVSSVLASTFKQVYATDISPFMLKNAIKKPNIIYSVSTAENLSQFSSSSIDLITVAEAAHWFNMAEFFKESARVLKPNGTLAIWGYDFNIFKDYPRATKMVYNLAVNEMDEYWEKGAKFLNDLYRSFIKVPEDLFQEIKWEFYGGDDTKGEVLMETKWPIPQYTNYLKVNIYSLYCNFIAMAL